MECIECHRDIADDAAFCQFCGAAQGTSARGGAESQVTIRYLRRSRVDRQLGGVCGGIARYLDIDPVFVRLAWVILTIIPGAIFLGVIAYLVAWLIIPDTEAGAETEPVATPRPSWRSKRLQRSASDARIAGVCGGIAEYFGVDSTAVRLLWVVLSIFPGAVVCGVLAYAIAWFVVPASPALVPPAQSEPAPAGTTSTL